MLIIDAFAAHHSFGEVGANGGSERTGDVSDLYIQVGQPMQFKTPAGLRPFGTPVTREEFVSTFMQAIPGFDPENMPTGRIEEGFDCPFVRSDGGADDLTEDTTIRVRMTVYRQGTGAGLGAVVRFGTSEIVPMQALGLEPMARALIDDLRGGVLVAGPAHAGKTYTMMSMADHINTGESGHIVTIEDPIEMPLKPKSCVVSQLEVGKDVASFHDGVLGTLRQSPIAVVVGEIRDSETAHAATRVLQSGHFLIAGIHGADGVEALSSYCALHEASRRNEDREQLARRLSGVIYQVQVPSADRRHWFVACEVISLRSGPNLRTLLSEGKWSEMSKAIASGAPGTLALNQSLTRLVKAKHIKPADAIAAAYDPDGLKKMLDLAQAG